METKINYLEIISTWNKSSMSTATQSITVSLCVDNIEVLTYHFLLVPNISRKRNDIMTANHESLFI
jgi:hypothetical protein